MLHKSGQSLIGFAQIVWDRISYYIFDFFDVTPTLCTNQDRYSGKKKKYTGKIPAPAGNQVPPPPHLHAPSIIIPAMPVSSRLMPVMPSASRSRHMVPGPATLVIL